VSRKAYYFFIFALDTLIRTLWYCRYW